MSSIVRSSALEGGSWPQVQGERIRKWPGMGTGFFWGVVKTFWDQLVLKIQRTQKTLGCDELPCVRYILIKHAGLRER